MTKETILKDSQCLKGQTPLQVNTKQKIFYCANSEPISVLNTTYILAHYSSP